MEEKKQENYVVIAVIEGMRHDRTKSAYEHDYLNIPKDAGILYDGNYTLNLGGKVNFDEIGKFRFSEQKGLEHKINPLFLYIEMPRAIIAKDGRIFINKNVISEKEYLEKLPTIIQTAKQIFAKAEQTKI